MRWRFFKKSIGGAGECMRSLLLNVELRAGVDIIEAQSAVSTLEV